VCIAFPLLAARLQPSRRQRGFPTASPSTPRTYTGCRRRQSSRQACPEHPFNVGPRRTPGPGSSEFPASIDRGGRHECVLGEHGQRWKHRQGPQARRNRAGLVVKPGLSTIHRASRSTRPTYAGPISARTAAPSPVWPPSFGFRSEAARPLHWQPGPRSGASRSMLPASITRRAATPQALTVPSAWS
jgi:hypothetical protein